MTIVISISAKKTIVISRIFRKKKKQNKTTTTTTTTTIMIPAPSLELVVTQPTVDRYNINCEKKILRPLHN